MRRSSALWLLPICRAGSLLSAALLLSACAVSSLSNPFKSGDQPLPPASQDGMLAEAKADAPKMAQLTETGESLHCPQVVAWPHDRLLTIYVGGKIGDAQAIMHRGEITKLSRQCQIFGNQVGSVGSVLGTRWKSGF